MTEQIIDYNKRFAKQKGCEKYITDKDPDKEGTCDIDSIVGGNQLKHFCALLSRDEILRSKIL